MLPSEDKTSITVYKTWAWKTGNQAVGEVYRGDVLVISTPVTSDNANLILWAAVIAVSLLALAFFLMVHQRKSRK